MENKVVIEGKVGEDDDGAFLHTHPPTEHTKTGYGGGDILQEFIGKRIRVTIEVLPQEDEDCPPATDADGRRPSGNEPW